MTSSVGMVMAAAGGPAITRNEFGGGVAWYLSTKLDGGDLAAVVLEAVGGAGIGIESGRHEGLEVSTRRNAADEFIFLINHSDLDAIRPARGRELITGAPAAGTVVVPAGYVGVVQAGRE